MYETKRHNSNEDVALLCVAAPGLTVIFIYQRVVMFREHKWKMCDLFVSSFIRFYIDF